MTIILVNLALRRGWRITFLDEGSWFSSSLYILYIVPNEVSHFILVDIKEQNNIVIKFQTQ